MKQLETTVDEVLRNAIQSEVETRVYYQALAERTREAAVRKRFAIEAYRSQLSAEEMDTVVRYNERRGGERIWIAQETEGLVPSLLEQTGIQAGNPAASFGRRFECAAHYLAGRARAACRRAQLNLRGGRINAPQTN